MVKAGATFEVGDYDFTKCSIVPPVAIVVDIPEQIEEPWYREVYVGYKDAAFEPSSPIRHATQLASIFSSSTNDHKSVLLLHSDVGPDHRLTYVSVKLSLIALFLTCNLDFLCTA